MIFNQVHDYANGIYHMKRNNELEDNQAQTNSNHKPNDTNTETAMQLYQHFTNSKRCIGKAHVPIKNKKG